MADFTNAEALGFSLKQTSTFEPGIVYWPKKLQKI